MLAFIKITGKTCKICINLLKVKQDQQMTYLMVLTRCFVFFSSDLLCKNICCGYTFELHRQVNAIQMGTHNICLYKEVDKKYTGCNLMTTEFLDSVLTGVCAVIRSNMVYVSSSYYC